MTTSWVRCCWCDTPLTRASDTHPWLCQTPACWDRIRPWVLSTQKTKRGKPTGEVLDWLFAPTPKQTPFFEQTRVTKHTLFGGAKAVAKSYALRWGLYRDSLRIPGLRCLLLRRTFAELENTHLLDMIVEAERLAPVGARYLSGSREFWFGNQSLIKAGHCESAADVQKFLSTQWDRIVFDEVITFECDTMFLPIASCARSVKPVVIQEGGAQVWGGTNPGGRGARWVKAFFVDRDVDRETYPKYDPSQWGYVPGLVDDNPYVEPTYRQTLENLPPMLRRQWLHGDWDAFEGQAFDFQALKDGQPWHVRDMGIAA